MRKLVALELQVYEKLKEGVGRVETPILNNLDQEMQAILNSQRPAHEKLRLYDAALRKSEQFEKKDCRRYIASCGRSNIIRLRSTDVRCFEFSKIASRKNNAI